jgi:hypothetical protein
MKTAGLHLIPIKSYKKNNHPCFNLKWTLVCNFMGWDGMGREILENRPIPWDEKFFDPIPWDGIPFKNLSSHPMGQLRKFLSHGTIFVVPWDPTRSPVCHNFCFVLNKKSINLKASGPKSPVPYFDGNDVICNNIPDDRSNSIIFFFKFKFS